MPVDPVRNAAIDVLLRVFERGVYVNVALDVTIRRKKGLSQRGKRFLAQLVYGTVRHKLLCDFVLAGKVRQPLDKLPLPILLILRMGVFQSLFCNQVTFPAMVHTSVELAKKRGHIGTARLTNAVLKRVPELLDEVDLPDRAEAPVDFLSTRYSLPPWLAARLEEEYGFAEAENLCAALDSEAPRTARTNTFIEGRADLLARLKKSGSLAQAHALIPEAITFIEGAIPFRGKAFQGGRFFVQDPASMLPPHLLEARAGERVLDLCAGLGGKATHVAQLTGCEALVVAMDRQPERLYQLRDNVERLTLSGVLIVRADAARPPFRGGFDRVLVDAPCTGLGTLRRHPDLKWRIREGDAARLAGEQGALLRSAMGLCKNGGLVVYSVCTFTREETEGVVESILEDGTATLEDGPEWLNQWQIGTGQYRILPERDQLDGYFLARLRKAS